MSLQDYQRIKNDFIDELMKAQHKANGLRNSHAAELRNRIAERQRLATKPPCISDEELAALIAPLMTLLSQPPNSPKRPAEMVSVGGKARRALVPALMYVGDKSPPWNKQRFVTRLAVKHFIDKVHAKYESQVAAQVAWTLAQKK